MRALPLVFMLALFFFKLSNAAVYKVGDSGGWTTIGNIDYKLWAATKTFQLGDTIRKFSLFPLFFWVKILTWKPSTPHILPYR